MTHPDHPTPIDPNVQDPSCASCGSPLCADQRYCLSCGTRRGAPRLDFSAFWGGSAAPVPSLPDLRSPSVLTRGTIAVLTAALLAGGIAVGSALGPSSSSSLTPPALAAALSPSLLFPSAPGGTSTTTPSTSTSATPPPITPSPTPTAKHAATGSPSQSSSPASPPQSPSTGESPSSASPTESTESPTSPAPANKGASKTAPATRGTLLSHYAPVASGGLANDVALLSGQGPTAATEADCPTYEDVTPPTVDATSGLASGAGCVYPAAVKTLADQTTEAGDTWKAYVQGLSGGSTETASSPGAATAPGAAGSTEAGGAPAGAVDPASTCRRPATAGSDPLHAPRPADPYVDFRNPFVYFHSLLDGGACTADDVGLSQLDSDLSSTAGPANLSWIVPSPCDDGSPTACAPGSAAGLASADAFLRTVIPAITASTAYKDHGLIVITFDSATAAASSSSTGSTSTTTTSSTSTTSPATPKPVGALLLSPFVGANARVSSSLNTFSLLKSIERLFGVPLLGHAADPGVTQLDAGFYRTAKKAGGTARQARRAVDPRAAG